MSSINILIQILQFSQFSTKLRFISFIRIKFLMNRYQICISMLDSGQFLKSKKSTLSFPICSKYSTSEKLFRIYFKFRSPKTREKKREKFPSFHVWQKKGNWFHSTSHCSLSFSSSSSFHLSRSLLLSETIRSMSSECILAVYLGADRSRHFQKSGIELEGPAVAYLVLKPESLQASRRSIHRFHLA